MSELTREQVEILANNFPGDILSRNKIKLLAHDAALRAKLDRSMRRQETLAQHVNDGLLERRALKAQLATAQEEHLQAVRDMDSYKELVRDLRDQLAKVVLEREGWKDRCTSQVGALRQINEDLCKQLARRPA